MFLHKHVDELGPLADVTLQQLGLATKPVVCVPAEMSTIKAFASMVVSEPHAGLGNLLCTQPGALVSPQLPSKPGCVPWFE